MVWHQGRHALSLGMVWLGLVTGGLVLVPSLVVSPLGVAQSVNPQKAEADRLLKQGNQQSTIGLAPSVLMMTTREEIAQTTDAEKKAEADRLLPQGIEQYNISQFEAAFQSWQQALNLYREIHDRQGEGDALGNLGNAYYALGNYPKAIEYQEQSLAISREIKDRLGEGQSLGNLGNAYYALGNYPKAIEYQEQSLAISRELKDRHGEGAALGNLGNAYYALGNYPKAIEYQEQSLAISRELKDRHGEGAALGNLGNAYYALGNYPKAIEYQEQSLAISRELKNRHGEGAALGNLGNAYYALGNYPKAIEYLEQRLAISREIKDRLGEGQSLGNLGVAYDVLRNYPKAIEYQEQSLAISRELKNRLGEGQSLGNLGVAYDALGNYPKAIGYQEQRLAISRELKDRHGEGAALGNLGNAYYALGNYPKAIEYQEQHLAISRELKDRLGEGLSLNNLGVAWEKAGNLAEAETSLLDSIAVYESLRDKLSDTERVSIADTQKNAYTNLQQVLVAEGKDNQALEIAERGRARAFVQLLASRLNSQTSEQAAPVSSMTLEQMRQVARSQNATLVSYSTVDDEQSEQLLIWVIQPAGEVSFRAVDLKPLQQQQMSLDKLVATARCFQDLSCESSITEQKVARREASGQETRTVAFNQALGNRLVRAAPPSEKNPHLQQLYQLLIDPISKLLPTDPNAQVIFIPQGSLFLLPFAALQDADGTYLIEQHTMRVAPSIQVLQLTQEQKQRVKQAGLTQALVVGNPTMPQQLPSLPGAQKEAEVIAPILHTEALTGGQATKVAVVKLMSQARIIHLATHGSADDRHGLQSWIALAPSGNDGGLLTADEILDLKLKAELVVLSACQTGKGQITGDGVIGLSRSIISAGVPSVMVSLWSVDDASTAKLMTEFYKELQRSPNKAQALRQAMLATKKDYPDPILWAAFVLIGEGE